MNSTLKSVLIFIGGAACGAAGMWYGVSSYYRSVASSEIDKMKEYIDNTYRKDEQKKIGEEKIAKVVEQKQNYEKEMLNSYKESIAKKTSYHKANSVTEENDHPEEDEHRNPYIITEEEWASPEPYYDKITLLYDKSDHSLTRYDNEELVLNPGDILGLYVLNTLDDMKTDSYLYVRDDQTSRDYEIEIRDLGDDEDENDT